MTLRRAHRRPLQHCALVRLWQKKVTFSNWRIGIKYLYIIKYIIYKIKYISEINIGRWKLIGCLTVTFTINCTKSTKEILSASQPIISKNFSLFSPYPIRKKTFETNGLNKESCSVGIMIWITLCFGYILFFYNLMYLQHPSFTIKIHPLSIRP